MPLTSRRINEPVVLPFHLAIPESPVQNGRGAKPYGESLRTSRTSIGEKAPVVKKNYPLLETMKKYFATIYSDKTINKMNRGDLNPILSVLVQLTKNIPRTISTLSGITSLGALVSKVFSGEKGSFFNSWGFISSSLIATIGFLGLDKLASAVLKKAFTPSSFNDEGFQKDLMNGIFKKINEALAERIKAEPNIRKRLQGLEDEKIESSGTNTLEAKLEWLASKFEIKRFLEEEIVEEERVKGESRKKDYFYVTYPNHRAEADGINFPKKGGLGLDYAIRIALDKSLKEESILMRFELIAKNDFLNPNYTRIPSVEPICKSLSEFINEGWVKSITPDLILLANWLYTESGLLDELLRQTYKPLKTRMGEGTYGG